MLIDDSWSDIWDVDSPSSGWVTEMPGKEGEDAIFNSCWLESIVRSWSWSWDTDDPEGIDGPGGSDGNDIEGADGDGPGGIDDIVIEGFGIDRYYYWY